MSFVSMDRLRAKGRRAWLFWRGDGQSALALDHLRTHHEAEVVGLVCSIDEADAADSVRPALRILVEEQAVSLELPIHFIDRRASGWPALLAMAAEQDLRAIALPSVRSEQQYEQGRAFAQAAGLELCTPLLGEPPAALSSRLLEAGFRSVVTRIDLSRVPQDLLGRVYSERFLAELSPELDPLGEDGAFDTFVCGGPGLSRPISPRLADMVQEGTQYRAVLGPGPKRAYGDV